MTTHSANETTAPARVVRLPVRCDNCGKDGMTDMRADPRPENKGNILCWTCWVHAMAALALRNAGTYSPPRDGRDWWGTVPHV